MSSVVIDGSAFRASFLALGESLHLAAARALEEGVDAAAKDAFSTNLFANHTWKLRTATKATVNKFAFTGRLVNKTKYASFIEHGTKAHVIKPRKAKRLRFYWHRVGAWVSSKGVNHPGTKARPFFKHAGQVGGSRIESELRHRSEQFITRFNRAA